MAYLDELAHEIDELVARAERSADPSVAQKYIAEALTKACTALKPLKRAMEAYARSILEALAIGGEAGEIEFRDFIQAREDLAMFASPQALSDFLGAARGPLEKLGYNPATVRALTTQASRDYESFIGAKVSPQAVMDSCQELSGLFCGPPDEDGLPHRPKPPKGPQPQSPHKIVIGYLAAMAALITSVAGLVHEVREPPPATSPTPIVLPAQLLVLLLCIGLKNRIAEEWGIPALAIAGVPA